MAEAQSTNEETLTENLAFAEVLAWSATRPAWQRDALRRLVQSGILGSEEIDELLEICLDPALPHTPLSDADVSSQSILGAPVSVLRIENPTGVNALAFDQKLEFAQAGLSIVYGDNGSGKSGYVRILKHACRTRDRNNKILRDVEDAAATPQTANIVFLRGATEDQFAWSPEAPSHADLPSISIFDSRSANVHVEKTNAVAYIPQPMRVLEALATACDQVKAKLDDRLAAINAKTPLAIKEPQLGADTAAGAFVRSLSTKSSIAQLDLLAQLSEAETSHLAALESDLAQEPKRAAAKITAQKARLDDGIGKLKNLVDTASPAAFAMRSSLKSDWETKAESAKLASDALFAASPLPDVGKATWRALWEAARKYSDGIAYPSRTFPHPTGHDELCVLCQQPMEKDAIERLVTFETFVKGSTKADEDAAEEAYSDAIKQAAAKHMSAAARRQFVSLIETEIGDVSLAGVVRECSTRAAWRLRSFVRM